MHLMIHRFRGQCHRYRSIHNRILLNRIFRSADNCSSKSIYYYKVRSSVSFEVFCISSLHFYPFLLFYLQLPDQADGVSLDHTILEIQNSKSLFSLLFQIFRFPFPFSLFIALLLFCLQLPDQADGVSLDHTIPETQNSKRLFSLVYLFLPLFIEIPLYGKFRM